MTDRWSAARSCWEEAFRPLVDAGYELERTDVDSYWKVHASFMHEHFPPEVFIDTWRMKPPEVKAKQEKLIEIRDDHALRDFTIVRKDGEIAAQFCGEQRSADTYRMWHSNVHADHRRKGLYSRIVSSTIAYTGQVGFDTIVSEHAPGNNAVIIAKLKAGFRITSMDVTPMVGVSVHLSYFHDPDHLAAYQFRCGLATVTPRILAHGSGAMPALREQLADSKSDG